MQLKHMNTGKTLNLGYTKAKGGVRRVVCWDDEKKHKEVRVRGKDKAEALVTQWFDKLVGVGYRLMNSAGQPIFKRLEREVRANVQLAVHEGADPVKIPAAMEEIAGGPIEAVRRQALIAYATTVKKGIPLGRPHDQMDALADREAVDLLVMAAAEVA